jgi:hypothetical protein
MEGQKLIVAYTWSGTAKKPSSLQVIRNYQEEPAGIPADAGLP